MLLFVLPLSQLLSLSGVKVLWIEPLRSLICLHVHSVSRRKLVLTTDILIAALLNSTHGASHSVSLRPT
jgi:hypothetical protein